MARVSEDAMALWSMPEELKRDPEVVFTAMCQDTIALECASDELCSSFQFMYRAAKQDITALDYASDGLLGDKMFMLDVVTLDWQALQFAAPALLSDLEILSIAVAQNWQALQYASLEARQDRRLMEIGLAQSGLAIQFACGPLARDRALVMRAVREDWAAFEHLAVHFQADVQIMTVATEQSWQALKFVPRWARISLPVMLTAVKQNWKAVKLILGDMHSEAELVAIARENPRVIQHQVLRSLRPVVLAAVATNGLVLQYACSQLKADREIVIAAVKQNPSAVVHACKPLQNDPAIKRLLPIPEDKNVSSPTPAQVYRDLSDSDFGEGGDDTDVGSNRSSTSSRSSGLFDRGFGRMAVASHNSILDRLSRLLDRGVSRDMLMKARRPGSRLQAAEELPAILAQIWAHPYSRVFTLEPGHYGMRGGQPYYKPCGWARFAVRRDRKGIDDWAVAYHGTTVEKAMWILAEGLQRPQGAREIAHGQAYSSTNQTIYVTPSIEYAAHPVYASLVEVGQLEWLQAVLEVRVRPGSFTKKPGSLGNKHWDSDLRMDRNFPTIDGLEWLVEDETAVCVTGVLLRELGRCANSSVYGDAAARVTEGEEGPEYEWTRLRCEQLREEGCFLKTVMSL